MLYPIKQSVRYAMIALAFNLYILCQEVITFCRGYTLGQSRIGNEIFHCRLCQESQKSYYTAKLTVIVIL